MSEPVIENELPDEEETDPLWELNNPEPGSGEVGTPENPWPAPPDAT